MDIRTKRIIENAVEIADRHLPKLQEHLDIGRGNIIADFIVDWAVEAEEQWEHMESDEADYYDFIDRFADKKMEEL